MPRLKRENRLESNWQLARADRRRNCRVHGKQVRSSDSDRLDNSGAVVSDNTTVNVNSSDNNGDILEKEQTDNNSTFIQYQQFTGRAPSKNCSASGPSKIISASA